MIISRAEHPSWLSNAYLVADRDGGHGVLVDSNGVEDPLLEADRDRDGITITHVLVTHRHPTTSSGSATLGRRFGVPVLAHPLAPGGRRASTGTIADGDVVGSRRPRDPRARDARTLPRPPRAACRRHRLPHGRRACSRARSAARCAPGGDRRSPTRVHSVMERADGAAARDPPAPRPRRADRPSATSGSRTRSSASGAGSTPRATDRVHGARRAGHAGPVRRPTTTAGTRRWVRFADGRDAIVGGSARSVG